MVNRDEATGKCEDTMAKIMNKVGIYFNRMQPSGERDDEQLELIGADRMGISWSREKDKFIFRITINVSQRKKKQPLGEDLTQDTIHLLEKATLS